jgi:hypothetical protein
MDWAARLFAPTQPINANFFGDTVSRAFNQANSASPWDVITGIAQTGYGAAKAPGTAYNEGMSKDDMIKRATDLATMLPGGAGAGLGTGGLSTPFYSRLKQFIEQSPATKAPGDQWLGTIKNTPGIKQEEMDWTGLQRYMAGKPMVTKQEALDFLDANKVDVQEVVKGGNPVIPVGDNGRPLPQLAYDDTKYSQYQLPEGENYRELLLTLPSRVGSAEKYAGKSLDDVQAMRASEGADFRSSHYDEPNVLAHVRFNDRVDAQGKKTLFIEEIQSDWHQKGRKQGYSGGDRAKKEAEIKGKLDTLAREYDDMGNLRMNGTPQQQTQALERRLAITDEMNALHDERSYVMKEEGVPDAPFKTSWPDLSLKRMIKWAADNGYDSVSWTPGKVQAERYDLSKQIDSLRVTRRNEGGYDLDVVKRGGHRDFHEGLATAVPEDKLADHVGKELAEKIAKQESQENTYTGLDLKVGGEGMAAFYDKMLVNSANKLGKKYGAKVEKGAIARQQDDLTVEELPQGNWGVRKGDSYIAYFPTKAEADNAASFGQEVWSLPITDAMRAEVGSKGMPLFQGGAGDLGSILQGALGGDDEPLGGMLQKYLDKNENVTRLSM